MRTRSLLLTLTLTLLASAAVAQDARTDFGLERARLLEAALMSMYPGTTAIEWGETIDLVQGTSRTPLRIVDLDYRPDDETGGGYTAVMSVERPNERQPIYDKIEAYEPAPARALSEVVAFKTNAQFGITALRRGSLGDAFSIIEEVQDVELTTLTYDQPWPDIYVTYTAVYATPEFFGEISWDEKLVVDPTITAMTRIPSLLWRAEKTGARRTDTATAEAPDENTLAFLSATSRQVVTRCTDPCLPDGRVLLALWWTMAKP